MKMAPEQREAEAKAFAQAAAEAADVSLRWHLSQVRRAHGLTLEEVADRMGVDVARVVLEVESVRSDPTLSILRRYAHAVGAIVSREVFEAMAEPDLEVEP